MQFTKFYFLIYNAVIFVCVLFSLVLFYYSLISVFFFKKVLHRSQFDAYVSAAWS